MESLLGFLEPLTWFLCTTALIVLFFLFVARPLLQYLFVNHEIWHRKKCLEAMVNVDLSRMGEGDQSNGEEGESVGSDAVQRQKTMDKDKIGRLAAVDPAKAEELVKKWVNSD